MKRVEETLEKIMRVMEKHYGENQAARKTVKVSRKKFDIFAFQNYISGKETIKITGSGNDFLQFSEKSLYVNDSRYDDLILLLESVPEEKLGEMFESEVLKFSQKQLDEVKEKEEKRMEKFKNELYELMVRFIKENYKFLKLKMNNYHYTLFIETNRSGNRFDFTFCGLKVLGKNASYTGGSYLYFEDLIKKLSYLSDEEMEEIMEMDEYEINCKEKEKASFEDRFNMLLEKRNDIKILYKLFGDGKYNRQVKRIDALIGQLVH